MARETSLPGPIGALGPWEPKGARYVTVANGPATESTGPRCGVYWPDEMGTNHKPRPLGCSCRGRDELGYELADCRRELGVFVDSS